MFFVWQKRGLTATKEPFKVSRATLFRWQKTLCSGNGKLAVLVPGSTAPKMMRRRLIPDAVKELIIKERSREKIGKEKLSQLIKDDSLGTYSSSTVSRMLGDLKRRRRCFLGRDYKKLTADNVKINYFNIVLSGNDSGDNLQPRITISLSVSPLARI